MSDEPRTFIRVHIDELQEWPYQAECNSGKPTHTGVHQHDEGWNNAEPGSQCRIKCRDCDIPLVRYTQPFPTYIYAIQEGGDGPIKIGFTKDVAARLRTLATANAGVIYVRALMYGDMAQEQEIHQILQRHRIRGEWFAPHPDVWEAIDEMGLMEHPALP